MLRPSFAAAVVIAAVPVGVLAQTSSAYTPPKLVQQGTASTPVAGAGDVLVQVLVKSDGSFTVTKVISSTNHKDDAAALEIAKSSTYKPALRDGKRVTAFYDYKLRFANSGNAAPAGATTPVAGALDAIRAGKYDTARTELTSYLQQHPNDTEANTLLGVADAFTGDSSGAAAAFDKAGTIPDKYRSLAAQAYAKYASSLIGEKKYAEAAAAANRLLALDANSTDGYFLRGIAEYNEGQTAGAIADLQKARDAAAAGKSDDKTIAAIEMNLAAAQYADARFDAADATAKDAMKRDPAQRSKVENQAFVAYYNNAATLVKAGKTSDAVARLEAGATAFPADAAKLYGQAAYILAGQKSPDWKAVKAEADKALAADASDGVANFVAAVALYNQRQPKEAAPYLDKAKASPTYSSDPTFAKQVDDALKSAGGGK